jgi:hypothetical protein
VETLPRLPPGKPKLEVWMGDVPDRPIAAMDMRRLGAAAVLAGPGWGATAGGVPAVLLFRPKSAVKVLEVKDSRRALVEVSGGELFSSDILCGVIYRCQMAVLFEAVLNPGSKLVVVVYKDRDVRRNVRLGIDESTVVAVLIVEAGGRAFFIVGNQGSRGSLWIFGLNSADLGVWMRVILITTTSWQFVQMIVCL